MYVDETPYYRIVRKKRKGREGFLLLSLSHSPLIVSWRGISRKIDHSSSLHSETGRKKRERLGTLNPRAPATQSASHETIYDVTLFFFVLGSCRPPTTLRYVSQELRRTLVQICVPTTKRTLAKTLFYFTKSEHTTIIHCMCIFI